MTELTRKYDLTQLPLVLKFTVSDRGEEKTPLRGSFGRRTVWGEDVTNSVRKRSIHKLSYSFSPGEFVGLCSEYWIHCLATPYKAIAFVAYNWGWEPDTLWVASFNGPINDEGDKCGVKQLTTHVRVPYVYKSIKSDRITLPLAIEAAIAEYQARPYVPEVTR